MSDHDWGTVAEQLLVEALDQVRSGVDVIPAVSTALTALRIEAGELPESELDGFMAAEPQRTCAPDLKARGGFTSTCPVCGPL